jgi:hypothetical protein
VITISFAATFNVTLKGTSQSLNIMGFMIRWRTVPGSNFGTFTLLPNEKSVQTMSCATTDDSITHTLHRWIDNEVTAMWSAPNDADFEHTYFV